MQRALELLGEHGVAGQVLVDPALAGQAVADPQPQVAVGRAAPAIESSATGTRGTLTMPDSMASIRPKSDTTHGKSVPSG